MRRFLHIALLLIVCSIATTGCLRTKVSTKTRYIIKPLISDGSTTVDMERYITAFAYNVDTTDWAVASYEDALAMRIVNKTTGEIKSEPAAIAEPFTESIGGGRYWVEMTLNNPTVMLVVIDPELKVYGYRKQTIGENMPKTYESVIFYTSKKGTRYKAGAWIMCNDFYIDPSQTPEGGGNDQTAEGNVTE